MRLLVQRVSRAQVTVEGAVVGRIDHGLLVLGGLAPGDHEGMFPPALDKLLNLRIFPDDAGAMNRSVTEVGGGVLAVSQFTLYADARKGRRPSFIGAMPPVEAAALWERFMVALAATHRAGPVAGGVFGAHMNVELVNDGPVTLMLDSAELNWGSGK
jgi:D-tyrosyl-tRNA(Tyr) deacylase